MNLSVDVVEETNKSIVNLAGEIDAYTAPELKEALLPLTKQSGHLVEVDLEQVNYMDSTGLGIFISALKSTKENNSQMTLVNIQDRVLRLFKITGLDEIMDINSAIRGGSE
ncbi:MULTISPECIES: STAS domain-containing protein [Virgibacillus]|uniref:Anti-sigma factor antagonist n=2 Tax=Virgibacillus TaxID=84406 RepID=A0A024QG15_9BACI|nr:MULTISPECIES: STAS domain-containing protein [Virgibacillus]EQB38776.1 positive regulator of sigma-B activity [Virgibacillus sp. CM-4]MYL43870.1 anti-sigma factor antagonist [Virgibacillus massiliensis]GGJ65966.1 anti-sigma-B factor antagonist [Virgibacillus kapii]CDQ40901.1 Anti-anti-sigma-B factor [Virgibacillus massiliensis]